MRPSKRDELVEKALQIFYRDGFHATGMDKLVAETGISKTSMYKYFRTKEELILATLELRHEQFNAIMKGDPDDEDATAREKLIGAFKNLRNWIRSEAFNSCMFIKASSEFQDPAHPIHAMAASHKRLATEALERLARDAGAREPASLARQLMLLQEGAIVTAHLQGKAHAPDDALDAARQLIDAACPV